jgi:hypothetical protein
VLYVVFTATFVVAFALSLQVLRRAGTRDHSRLGSLAGVTAWALLAAVLVTAPVDGLTGLITASAGG